MVENHDFTNEEPAEVIDTADEYLLYALKMKADHVLHNELMETKSGKIISVSGNRTEIIEQALRAGANPNIINAYGYSMLMCAANAQETELFLRAGANVNFRNTKKDVRGGSVVIGQTALMLAHDSKQTELLLKAGADVNMRDENGNTAVVYAIRNNDGEQFKSLVAAGASLENLKSLYKTIDDYQADNRDILGIMEAERKKVEADLSVMYDDARKSAFLTNKRHKLAQRLGLENVKLPKTVEKVERKLSKIISNVYSKVRE